MYQPVKGGHIEEVDSNAFGWKFKCWVPPVGYGVNKDTGELEKTTVYKRSHKKEDQYWERIPLPDWYEEKREEEEERQKTDPEYFDPECEKVREDDWTRRLCGMWFYNNGNPTYITGTHYMYLNWWPFQSEWMDYWEPDRKYWYAVEYSDTDPYSLGTVNVTRRKSGKTAKSGVWVYEYISRNAGKHGGIQSKTNEDAEEVFQKAIVEQWQTLPHFYRPIYDEAQGDAPKKELRFFHTSKRGKRKKINKNVKALNSFIDYKNVNPIAYDGPELHRYISDECGKLKDVSIMDRHDVVKKCSLIRGVMKGKHMYTSTVGEMEAGGGEFEKLVKQSDATKRDANGHTVSGLYVWFQPAYETYKFDKYGFPDIEAGKIFYMNTRAALTDPRSLSAEKRQNPFSLEEAFRADGTKTLYNSEMINDQIEHISWRENIVERGNFVWKDNIPFTEVEWQKNPNGRWYILTGFKFDKANNVTNRNGHWIPNNAHLGSIGFDPFKYDKTKDNRRSDGAGLVLMKYDAANPNSPYSNCFVCMYKYRTDTRKIQYDDALKMAWYFGMPILFERNVDNWRDYFTSDTVKCEKFLVKLPDETEYGIYTDGKGQTTQSICEYTEQYIEENCKKVFFLPLLDDWLKFDPGDTTKFDVAMAAGITLISATRKIYKENNGPTRKITDYVPLYKAL